MCFSEESFQIDAKFQILKFLRVPSIWNLEYEYVSGILEEAWRNMIGQNSLSFKHDGESQTWRVNRNMDMVRK